jgi:glycosyltransferase involved in cell wall biosynthesis
MHIAVCGPISVQMLKGVVQEGGTIPVGYVCPLIAFIVQEYIRQGHFITIVSVTSDVEEEQCWRGDKCNIYLIPARKRVRQQILDFYRKEVHGMRAVLRRENPDVIHAMWTYEFADAAIGSGIPTLVTCHDSPWRVAFSMRQTYRFIRAFYAQFWVLPRAKHMTAVSPHIVEDLRWLHGYCRSIQLIPNGFSGRAFDHKLETNIATVLPTIVVVSEWGRLKNVIMSIRAFVKVRERFSDVRMMLFGSGLGKGQAAEMWCMQEHIVTDGMEFYGYQQHEKIFKVLRTQATLFLHTSLEESFCMTILEAMSHGIACVGGQKSGAVPWLLDNGRAGVLVDVNNSEAIAMAAIKLIENGAGRERLADAGYERARTMFSLENVVKKYVALLEKIRAT